MYWANLRSLAVLLSIFFWGVVSYGYDYISWNYSGSDVWENGDYWTSYTTIEGKLYAMTGVHPNGGTVNISNGGTVIIGATDAVADVLNVTNGSHVIMNNANLWDGYNTTWQSLDIHINNATFTQNGGLVSYAWSWLTIADNGTYNLNGGEISANASAGETISSGTFNQTGGRNQSWWGLAIGTDGGTATYNLSAGTLVALTLGDLAIGGSGTGNFIQTGGSASVNNVNIGANGFYSISNGSLSTSTVSVGNSGTNAAVSQSGGTISASVTIGNGGIGVFNLSGGLLQNGSNYVGYSGNGTFNQTGGTNNNGAVLGYNSGIIGTYNLDNGSLSGEKNIGYSGTGTFTQNGGTNSGNIYLGYNASSVGTYLFNNGQITSGSQYVGYSGSGAFTQNGGTNSITSNLYLGYNTGSGGTYALDYEKLTVSGNEYIGYSGTGAFTQTGGQHTITGSLVLANGTDSHGSYALRGGQLTSTYEYFGLSGTGTFTQTSGTNFTSFALVNTSSRYEFGGGMLSVSNGGLDNQGVFDFGSGTGSVTVSKAIVNFMSGNGTLLGTSGGSLSVDANSLVIVPAGFNPATFFSSCSNSGLIHERGTTLTIEAGRTLVGAGYIDDFTICQGTINTPANSVLNFKNGLQLSDGGTLSGACFLLDSVGTTFTSSSGFSDKSIIGYLGSGTFSQTGSTYTRNSNGLYLGYNSGSTGYYNLSGGQLTSAYDYYNRGENIGYSGTGLFTQSGGTNSTNYLYLGYNSGANGTYKLSGGELSPRDREYIGYSGIGSFAQTNGKNTTKILILGESAGSYGSYVLNDGTLAVSSDEYVGYSGVGTFCQTGGTNTVGGSFYFGYKSGSSGSYNLSGGQLSAGTEYVGRSGAGSFIQTGGTNTIKSSLVLGQDAGSTGSYHLSDGQLTISNVVFGDGETIGSSGTGIFTQTGGTNTTGRLSIGATGTYTLSGGILNLSGDVTNNGIFDLANGSPTININSTIITLSNWGIKNSINATLNIDANSLVLVSAGYDPSQYFGHFNNAGILHQIGTTLTISSERNIACYGTISDFVDCRGSLAITKDLNGGVFVSGTGKMILGGNLYVNDTLSGISGGLLRSSYEYVGYSGMGTFTQTGGTNSIQSLNLGYNNGSTGTYNLSGSQLSAGTEYVGYSGTGTFAQTDGTNIAGYVYLGLNSGSSGTYNLSGGQLTNDSVNGGEYIGSSGTGTFSHSGGTNTISNDLYLGYNSGSRGTYILNGTGSLSAGAEYIGCDGTGSFTQSDGTNSGTIYLGYGSGAGSYNLSGGLLSSDSEYVGVYGTGTFTQTGGTNSTDSLTIGSKGTYTLSGGILNLGGDVINNGIFDLANSYATINVNAAITNVSNWNVRNATNASLNADSYSLLFVSAGFDPSHYFGHFNNAGIIHQIGTTLTISSIYNISSKGIINDFVDCQGSLVATTGNSIMLNGGVFVSGNGNVNLGSGELRVDNAISGVSGGQLSAYYEYVGNSGTGSFTQSGGTHSVSNYFYLGYKTGSSGSYNLIGGQLTSYDEYVGGSGSGKVTQAGGVNTIRNALYLGGYTTGSSGLYNLNGGQLISSDEYVGYLGSGNITQTGGANIISGSLLLGCYSRTSGIYNLNGGTLCLKGLEKGSGIAVFNFGGGTLLANGSFTSSLLMTLTGMNGEAHIDTNGYNVTLSGALSGPGGLNKLGAGTLTLSTTESFSGDTIVNGGTLVFSGGIASSGTSLINVDSGKVVLQTTNITKPDLEIITGATGVLEIASGSHTLDTISGSGSTIVDKGASLTVSSIVQNTLTIGSSSGTAVQSYSATTIDNSIAAVPEPGTLVLLTFSCLLFLARKKFA